MGLTYLAPPTIALLSDAPARWIAAGAWAAMTISFVPILRFYRVNPLLALALPLIAALYLAFTLDSAYQHGRGRGGMWKGRVQALPAEQR